jgi:hypothetical protein
MAASDSSDLRQLGEDLHQRLVGGDPTASSQIAEEFLPFVIAKLQNKYPNLDDPHLVAMAADDATLNYLDRPSQYDPKQLPLDRYLLMSAENDLLNSLRGLRISGLPKKIQVVELDVSEWEYEIEDDSLSVEDQVHILTSPIWSLLETLLPHATDRRMASLMLEGVHSTKEYAALLGITDMPKEEQEAEVKRHKDRIKKMLQRHIHRSDLDKP